MSYATNAATTWWGIAKDLDVSAGSTSPFDRPQLGDWLSDRLGEFDVIVFFRADWIVRRLFDLADLIRWGREQQHGSWRWIDDPIMP